MPKSKRSQLVALTQTSKATRTHKSAFIQEVRENIDKHDSLYIFSYENMRSNHFKKVRMHFREDSSSMDSQPSRIFLGKNKLLQIALGRSPEEEYADNLRHASKLITGSCVGILMTSRPRSEVEDFFQNFVEPDFARAGCVAPREVTVTNEMLTSFPVSMVDQQFRKLGLAVQIDNGKVVLQNGQSEVRICKEGETLSVEKCKLLVHFGIKLSEFRVKLVCRWANGEFEMLD